MVQGPWWKLGSGLMNENTFGGMKTDCVSSKKNRDKPFCCYFSNH